VFYVKLTRTTIPKILSVSPLTTKEHPYNVKTNLQGSFFIINLYSILTFSLLANQPNSLLPANMIAWIRFTTSWEVFWQKLTFSRTPTTRPTCRKLADNDRTAADCLYFAGADPGF